MVATLAAGYHSVALPNAPGQGAFFRACSPDAHTRGAPGELKRWMQGLWQRGHDVLIAGGYDVSISPTGFLVPGRGVSPGRRVMADTRDDHQPGLGWTDPLLPLGRCKPRSPLEYVNGGLRDNLAIPPELPPAPSKLPVDV